MERIKALVNMILFIAMIVLISTWTSLWHIDREDPTQAYAKWQEYMESIQAQLQLDDTEPLFTEAQFAHKLSDEQLSKQADEWLTTYLSPDIYEQETMDEIKQEIIALYHSHQTWLTHPVYQHYVTLVRIIAISAIVLSLLILWLIMKKQTMVKQETKTIKTE